MKKIPSLETLLKGRRFERDVIVLCLRRVLRFKLSFRDLVEGMAERGLALAHATITRWVPRSGPEVERRWNRHASVTGRSWRADVTIAGIEPLHRLRKGQSDLGRLGVPAQTTPSIRAAVLSA